MKRILFFLLVALSAQLVNAQSVGIGTTTPNASAQLDVVSTTKGLLIPRMTGSQRNAIASPVAGLLVYQTNTTIIPPFSVTGFYVHNGTEWKLMARDENLSWTVSGNDQYSNVSGNVGIGTNSPSERLDVNGNIRSRDDILADNNITATGNIGAASISTGGNLTAGGNLATTGTSFLNGNVTTNGDLIVNNSGAILQLKNGSNVNTGYFQLSGNNVRMGTNSGNSTGNLIIRMNGNDRVTINPAGDINLDGKITRTSVTGNAPLLPVCFGQVDDSGTIINGTGNFTVARTGFGRYEISSPLFTSTSVILATLLTPGGVSDTIGAGYLSSGIMIVSISAYRSFQFIVFNLN
jgi:hypothetical protein